MTLIIKNASMGYIDYENRKVIKPCKLRLTEKESDYLHDKIERLFSLNLKEIKDPNSSLQSKLSGLTNGNEFMISSNELFKELVDLVAKMTFHPNTHVLLTNFALDNNEFAAIILLNNKKVDDYLVLNGDDTEEGIISYRWQMPAAKSNIEEAVIMNINSSEMYLLEKKFELDEKKDFYLNECLIKGIKQMSYKEILNLTLKAINKIASLHGSDFKDEIPILFKEYINVAFIQCEDIYPYLIPNEMNLESDIVDEIHNILNDLGIDENVVIPNKTMGLIDDKYSKCKVKLDDEIEVSMSVNEYLEGERFHYKQIADRYSISLDDIQFVEIK